jgi:dihydroorotate dehydrogenase
MYETIGYGANLVGIITPFIKMGPATPKYLLKGLDEILERKNETIDNLRGKFLV